MSAGPPADIEPVHEPSKLQRLFVEYGRVAFVLWWVMALAVMIPLGVLAGTKGGLGLWGSVLAGWAGAQPTKPLRIAALVVLTPVVARWVGHEPLAAEPHKDADAHHGDRQ